MSVNAIASGLNAGMKTAATLASGKEGADAASFLSALLDRLSQGKAGAANDTETQITGDALAAALAQISATTDASSPSPDTAALLTNLTDALGDVSTALANGDTPDKDALGKLSDAIDALLALLLTQQPPTQQQPVSPGGDADLDPLAALGAAATSGKADTGAATPFPAIAQLADDLDALGTTLASTAPELADKLKALGARLNGAQSDPAILSTLDGGDDAGSIDDMVAALLKGAPATPPASDTSAIIAARPQLAVDQTLKTPEGLVKSTDDTADVAAVTPQVTDKPGHDAHGNHGLKPDDKGSIATIAAHAAGSTHDQADTTATNLASAQPLQPGPAAKVLPAAYQNAVPHVNMAQVAFEMAHQMQKGQSRFTIRLDPPELGRVDVRMNVDPSGNVHARLTVEKAETLDMFQRDKTTLERALAQAGLDGAKTNLEFSLRQNPFAGMAGGDQRSAGQGAAYSPFASDEDADTATSPPAVTLYRGTASAGGLNLFV